MIPIYRAKKIDSDEYVEGFLSNFKTAFIVELDTQTPFTIDPSTLAIHFPDMIDSDGTKIFASLSEDGKGGDIVEHPRNKDFSLNGVVVITSNGRLSVNDGMLPKWIRLKVTGIQE